MVIDVYSKCPTATMRAFWTAMFFKIYEHAFADLAKIESEQANFVPLDALTASCKPSL